MDCRGVASARPLLFLALLIGLALAGCTGEDGEEPGPGTGTTTRLPGNGANPGSGFQDGLGTIDGVVLNAGYEPVNGARVRLFQDGESIGSEITDTQGTFRFEEVTTGRHRLEVSASCCRDWVKQVSVHKDQTTRQNIVLDPLPATDSQRPYAVRTPWEGFIGCGFSLVGIQESPCTFDASDDREHRWNVTEGIRTLYVRMDWEPAEGLGETLRLVVDAGAERTLAEAEGVSPLEITIHEEDIEDPQLLWSTIEGQRELFLRVGAGGEAGVAYQQAFAVNIIEFYWRAAPEDFSYAPSAT